MKRAFLLIFCAALLVGGCATSRYTLADGHLKRREYLQALRSYLRELEPHAREGKRFIYYEREAVTGIGVVYWNMQRYETAVKILRLVTEKDPDYGKAAFYMGLCHEALGNDNAAAAAYGMYERIQPSDPFRQAMAGRLDYLVKRKVSRDVDAALRDEAQLDLAGIPEKSVAVLPFVNLSEDRQWEPFQKGLAEMVIADLSRVGEIQVAERLQVEGLLTELGLTVSDLSTSPGASRFGKCARARYFLKGSFLIMSDDRRMTLDAGLTPAENPETAVPFNADGNLSQMFQMEKQLVLKVVDAFGIALTSKQREDILEIPTQNLQAFLLYCRGLDALDIGDYRMAFGYFQEAVQTDPYFQKAKDWMIFPDLWDATHAQNLNRVDRDVAFLMRPGTKARLEAQNQTRLLSTLGRLNQMGIRMNAGFLPGNDSRKSFQEAELLGHSLLPERLGDPPPPPGL